MGRGFNDVGVGRQGIYHAGEWGFRGFLGGRRRKDARGAFEADLRCKLVGPSRFRAISGGAGGPVRGVVGGGLVDESHPRGMGLLFARFRAIILRFQWAVTMGKSGGEYRRFWGCRTGGLLSSCHIPRFKYYNPLKPAIGGLDPLK